jgi:anti-sigma regulatory factor (Ser/Thr protein kinase)
LVHSTQFPREAVSIAAARRVVQTTLARCTSDTIETARLLTSELATNAVVHAKTGFELVIADSPVTVRIEVSDSSPLMPRIQPVDRLAPHGRGLHLVERLAESWGVIERPHGKTVWFELRCGAV